MSANEDLHQVEDGGIADEGPKVLWIFDHYSVPPGDAGFVRQHDLAVDLQKHNWETRVYSSAFNHKTHEFARRISPRRNGLNLKEGSVDYTWIYTTPYEENSWRRYLNIVSYFVFALMASRQKPKPDVILGASPHLFAPWAAWVVARRYRVPLIVEVQDLWPATLIQLGLSNPPIKSFLTWLEGFVYAKADAIVTLADGITEGVRRRLSTDKPVVMIQNGAPPTPPLSDEERSEIRHCYGWDNAFVGIWAGQHGAMNSLETVVEAARILESRGANNFFFAMVGDGPEKPRLQALSDGLSNIRFYDPVPKSEATRMVQASDVGLMIYTDFEAMRGARPTKLTEYMAAGVPVVNNLPGEAAQIIAEAGVGFTVKPMDPVSLADGMVHAAELRDELEALGRNGIPYVQQTADRTMLSEKMRQLLESVIRSST